ncbi:type VII secretion target [Actinokineospora soli]|uniref:Type VII secretion target n=1 Tax=Actinokineospora soli TaxID=1048753 RepID=A0ABW2TMR3_9PSEU
MTGYRTEPDQLDRHASGLAGVADRLASVATRLPDGLGDQPLGAFGQFLSAGLESAMGSTADAIDHAASTSDTMAVALANTAAHYRATDEQNAASFDREGPR